MQTVLYNNILRAKISAYMSFWLNVLTTFLGLLDAWKKRQDKALESFVVKFHPLVFGIIRKRVFTESEVEDIEQDFFLKFIEKNLFARFRGQTEKEFYAYIIRIAINHTNEYLRKNLKARSTHEVSTNYDELEERVLTGGDDAPDQLAVESELMDSLDGAIARLPANYKSIVKLRLLNHTNREIAEILDMPKGTVDVYLARAMKILKEDLRNYR